MESVLVSDRLCADYKARCKQGDIGLLVWSGKQYCLDFVRVESSDGPLLSEDLLARELTKKVQDAVEDTLNKKASVLLGGLYVNGLVVSLDEGKERNLGDSLAKLKHSFKDSAEHWGEKLYILNSQTGHSFSFDLASCYLGTVKLNEFELDEKIIRANLRVKTIFKLEIDSTDAEWEDKSIKMIIENLKNRKYTVDDESKVIDGGFNSKLPQDKSGSIMLTLLRTPWDTNILTEKDNSDKELATKYLQLNLYLESYQPRDAPFSTILSNLCMDLDRTLIDRIYTNLDYCYVHLPKRVIARSDKSRIGYPVYVLPEENVKEKLRLANFEFKVEAVEEEKPYGGKSHKTQQPGQPNISPGSAVSGNGLSPVSDQLTPGGQNGHLGLSPAKIEDGRSLSFDGTSREKIFMSIVAAVLAIYLYFKFIY